MVTSTKLPEKKVVSMAEPNDTGVVPQRTLLGEVNEHITCPLCRGYYIDATTIVECLHSFCRSCIIKHLQVKKYCPVCEMMINSAKPNIKLDKALQDIVYKLVPGLFQKEMERRQQFYASRPGPAASATPEQRGEDTERIIFSPEDVISFSLEFADVTDADSTSSKSSDSNESQLSSVANRRYLQCPAVVNINHLKKFLSMKFDIDSTLFAIEILYKRVPLPDYYTLMDIAYIYNWKRNEPMRFIYQIIDYVAIRNRLFDNRKDTQFRDRKSSPASTEDTNASSPAPHLHDPCSEASSGTDSPMPDDSKGKQNDSSRKHDTGNKHKDVVPQDGTSVSKSNVSGTSSKKNEDDVEKSQFLNSFELTATNSCPSGKSPIKSNQSETSTSGIVTKMNPHKTEETAKRKMQMPTGTPEMKKLKVEIEKAIFPMAMNIPQDSASTTTKQMNKSETCDKAKDSVAKHLSPQINSPASSTGGSLTKDAKQLTMGSKSVPSETPGIKRNISGPPNVSSPKRSKPSDIQTSTTPSTPPSVQKTVSPLKLQLPKLESQTSNTKTDLQKPHTKRMPDLKPSSLSQMPQSRGQQVNRVRMDLLANNSDPTIDRSKILSQVKSSLSVPNTSASGDPIKSLFDSCKINIPSSLSITLTDQKLDPRSVNEPAITDQKKNVNVPTTSNNPPHKVPSHPVRNSIEILKLTDSDTKKQNKSDGSVESKTNSSNKGDTVPQQSKPLNKSESSAKGPVPNLKPISDTKLAKQSGNFAGPITFQQTFEQQLRSVQTDKKSKLPKNKTQVPKLVPATPKNFSAANKLNISAKSSPGPTLPLESKPSTALDLSTPHPIQSQLNPQQTKAFETMQSIANLAKKQNPPSKGLPLNIPQSNVFSNVPNIPMSTVSSPLRIPSTTNINQIKLDKVLPSNSQTNRQDVNKVNSQQIKPPSSASPSIPSPGYQIPSLTHNSPNSMQPSPRSTRSPSSSPKLVIAEEKHTNSSDHNTNQSNQISSTQMSSMNVAKSESPKPSPGPSKSGLKPIKSLSNLGKPIGIRQPITTTMKSNPALSSPADYLTQPQLIAHHALFRQIDMQNAWLAQRQYDLYKNIAAHQNQNDFNKNKDNKQ